MTNNDKRNLLLTFLFLGVGGGVVWAIVRNRKKTNIGTTYPGGSSPTPGGSGPVPSGPSPVIIPPIPSSGLTQAIPGSYLSPSGIACQSGDPAGCRTSPFGWRPSTNSYHYGMDIRASSPGHDIVMKAPGTIYSVATGGGWGKRIGVRMSDGTNLLFAHLKNQYAVPGQNVYPGDIIGTSGNTGGVPWHLHYEVCGNLPCDDSAVNGGPSNYSTFKVDPTPYLHYFGLVQ